MRPKNNVYIGLALRVAVPKRFLTMYPFSTWTDEHVLLKFPLMERLNKITNID